MPPPMNQALAMAPQMAGLSTICALIALRMKVLSANAMRAMGPASMAGAGVLGSGCMPFPSVVERVEKGACGHHAAPVHLCQPGASGSAAIVRTGAEGGISAYAWRRCGFPRAPSKRPFGGSIDRNMTGPSRATVHGPAPSAVAGRPGPQVVGLEPLDEDDDDHHEVAASLVNTGLLTARIGPVNVVRSLASVARRTERGVVGHGGRLAVELLRVAVGSAEVAPAPSDRRWQDSAWRDNPLFRRLALSYLALEREVADIVEGADVDWRTRERARFGAGILTSALSPTNLLLTNPAAMRRARESRGRSLVRGARNLGGDVVHRRSSP